VIENEGGAQRRHSRKRAGIETRTRESTRLPMLAYASRCSNKELAIRRDLEEQK
jgi:hypothetical protein